MYCTHTLSNGLRLVHLPCDSPVAYCGFVMQAGTRDEDEDSHGMAHFVEHVLFKGTKKRKAWHILNRMEAVGGELNAYTTKEETFVYSTFLEPHFERAMELLSDIVFEASLPEHELKKEIEVIQEEILSYQDNPAELIYDDFENLVFEQHALGHDILGSAESVAKFTSESGLAFIRSFYRTPAMVFFSMGRTPFSKIMHWAERYLGEKNGVDFVSGRKPPLPLPARSVYVDKNTSQAHVMLGTRAYNLYDKQRIGLYLINNVLGGPGMNSRLNLALREKRGWVYQVDSSLTTYTDTGLLSVYFGCEQSYADKCLRLIGKELAYLRDNKWSSSQLWAAQKQLKGQLGVANEHRENTFLSLGKSYLYYNKYDDLASVYQQIDDLSREELWDICNEVLVQDKFFLLQYQ